MEAFIDHHVEELIARAREHGRAKGEQSLTGEPQRTLALTAWRADRGVWLALNDVSELQRLRRIRTEFIDNLSHELRTPLTTVRLLTELLAIEAERTDLPPRMRDSIAKIDVETGHLAQMVNEILELSRIEGGPTEMHFEELPLGTLVSGAAERLRTFADRQGVSLKVELPPDADSVLLRGDEERLGQVLVNLLHNAIKFSAPDSPVTVSARRDGAQCVISVADQGVGIPRADVDRVFERFYKVDKARHRGRGGTGLGLSIAPTSSTVTAAGSGSRAKRVTARPSAFPACRRQLGVDDDQHAHYDDRGIAGAPSAGEPMTEAVAESRADAGQQDLPRSEAAAAARAKQSCSARPPRNGRPTVSAVK